MDPLLAIFVVGELIGLATQIPGYISMAKSQKVEDINAVTNAALAINDYVTTGKVNALEQARQSLANEYSDLYTRAVNNANRFQTGSTKQDFNAALNTIVAKDKQLVDQVATTGKDRATITHIQNSAKSRKEAENALKAAGLHPSQQSEVISSMKGDGLIKDYSIESMLKERTPAPESFQGLGLGPGNSYIDPISSMGQ